MKKILLLFSLVICLSFTGVQAASAASSEPFEEACSKLNQEQRDNSAACSSKETTTNPVSGGTDSVLYKATKIITSIAGIAAVIMAIVAGINMMTSGGDSQKFANGRNTLIFAAVGLVIIFLARALVTLVVNRATT